jgi:hypothetical protein
MLNRDFSDLFAAFDEAGVEYLVVGAHAVAFHAEPRFTKDLDVWVNPSPANAARVLAALRQFGAPLAGVSEADFAAPGVTLQLGVAPNRIDIATAVDGVAFAEAWPNRIASRYGDEAIWIIGRDDLVANKRAAGRAQDLLDLQTLEKHK